jgi:hypothetical protein
MNVTGITKGGKKRITPGWRRENGPSVNRRHHLIPQAMKGDNCFINRLKAIGIKDPIAFIDRQIADIPNVQHIDIHNDGWNADFKSWFCGNPNFSKDELMSQIKKMMHDYNVPRSTQGGVQYGR